VARLIRTEKEVEGRYEDVWLVVEEDPLDQWPAGPLDVVGQPAPRQDGLQRATGKAVYTADIDLPGMLHTAVLRSPFAHGRITSFDASAALESPGVRAVLEPGSIARLVDEANFQGQSMAAVAADTYAQARIGLARLEVQFEELEPMIDPEEAVEKNQLHGEPRRYERGDVSQGFAEADVVVEATYRTQSVLHNSLESHQSVCDWEGDQLVVYISTQYIWGVRDEIAGELGLPPDKVRVVCNYMGGGFGSKNNAGDYTYVAIELAKRTGRPVKCALTRREEMIDAGNRNATIQKLRAGARADGTLVALEGEFIAALGWGGWHASTAGPMQMLYACDNVRTVERAAKLNTPPMKAFRAPGFVEGTFGLECLLDEVAAKLEIDSLEIRRRNYAHAGDGRPYSSKNLMECYDRAEAHWQRRDEIRAFSDRTWKRGVGLASQIWYGGGGPPSYAWIRLGADGRAQVVTAMQDIGTGSKTAMQQIAAEELGLPVDRVEISAGDSSRGPWASISAGSSTIPSMGPAVRAAAADAAWQVIEIAAQRHDRAEGTLSLKGGHVVCSDGGSWPLEEIVGVLESGQILGKGARGPNPAGMQVLTFGVQVAEVAVDVETGEIRVERIAAVHDVGRVINPLGASSQVEGGIIQGIGHTLSENRLLDPETGRTLTTSLDAYKLPTIADVPEIVTDLLDVPDPHLTNLGAKGLGEPPIVPVAAAIANAIRDATGADVRSLPITREEMLRALEEARKREREREGVAV
jgi:xanthine dehydrogenase YagR molybdenum-binding subunit